MNKRRFCRFLMAIFAGFSILLTTECSSERNDSYMVSNGAVWNTTYHITYRTDKDMNDSILKVFEDVSASVSAFNTGSLVSRFNRGDSIVADTHLRKVYERSVCINRESLGAFDPTVSPLINFWGFGYDNVANPDTSEIKEILKYVGMEKTAIRGGILTKTDPRLEFNFSAIAKGYGCDCIAEMFHRNGINDFIIEIGGEIVACGKSPRGGKWNVAIDRPVYSPANVVHDAQCVISLSNSAVATSGDYRNFRKTTSDTDNLSGIISHTIDAHTGYPVKSDLASVTIVADNCMDADAYATACLSMNPDEAEAMAKRLNLSAMFIYKDGSVWMTEKFENSVIK